MLTTREYFPLGRATDVAFCNRIDETKTLCGNVVNGKHSLIIAPRRYGKTSLAERAIATSKLPWVEADFYLCLNEHDVEQIILHSVSELIGNAIGQIDKLINTIKQYVKNLKPKIVIGPESANIIIETQANSNVANNIKEALMLIEHLLVEKKQRAAMFFDEFQLVGMIAKGGGVEGAIRHVAQKTRYLSIIFSGSHRALLKTMFEDSSRPLYKLCRKLNIDRIAAEHYQPHLNKIAILRWNSALPLETFNAIMSITQRHPYYVNYLCDVLWSDYATLPSLDDVTSAWETVVQEERGDLISDFINLADGQKKILKYLARKQGGGLLSKASSRELDMAVSSIAKSAAVLAEKDMIEKVGDIYKILNPALTTVLG